MMSVWKVNGAASSSVRREFTDRWQVTDRVPVCARTRSLAFQIRMARVRK
jgi:hypothetical protein